MLVNHGSPRAAPPQPKICPPNTPKDAKEKTKLPLTSDFSPLNVWRHSACPPVGRTRPVASLADHFLARKSSQHAMNLAYSIFLLVTILLLSSHGSDEKKRARESLRLRPAVAGLRRGKPRIDPNFSQSLWRSAICLSRNSCDSREDLIQNPKTHPWAEQTHPTPQSTSRHGR
jgi:hypothetical protein